MQQKQLKVEVREKTGKGISRSLRREGLVPGVVYGKGMDSVSVAVCAKELLAALAGEGGHNNLIVLQGGASLDGSTVIAVEMDRDPLKGTPRHVDFHKISMTETIKVIVPVNIAGTAAGVKNGGLLDVSLHSLHIECLPGNIPEHIDVAVVNLQIGQTIHVGELQLPEGIRVTDDPKAAVVSVLGGKVKEEGAA